MGCVRGRSKLPPCGHQTCSAQLHSSVTWEPLPSSRLSRWTLTCQDWRSLLSPNTASHPKLNPAGPGNCWPAEEAAPRGADGTCVSGRRRAHQTLCCLGPRGPGQAWRLMATCGLVSFQLLAAAGRTWTQEPSQRAQRVTKAAPPHICLPPFSFTPPLTPSLPSGRTLRSHRALGIARGTSVSNTDKMACLTGRVCVNDTEMSPGPGESLWADPPSTSDSRRPSRPKRDPRAGAQSWLSCRSPARRRWEIVPWISYLYLWGSSSAMSQPIDPSDGQPAASQPQPLHTDSGCLRTSCQRGA